MKTRSHILSAILVLILCWGAMAASAQEAAKPQTEQQNKQVEPPPVPYRLDFTLSELQEGKKINTRRYSMNLNLGRNDNIKIGARVPIETAKDGQIQYVDVGTNIWARLAEEQNALSLQVKAEISNFALPDEAVHPSNDPVIRQLIIGGSTVATLGKTISIGSMDDPNSNHQFQLEVTVTKLN